MLNMSLHGGLQRRWIVVLAVLGTCLATVGAAALLVQAAGLSAADQLASVASLLVGLVSLSLALRPRGDARSSPGREAELLGNAADRLAALVRLQWQDEAGARGLRDPRPIRVRWSSTSRPIEAPADSVLGRDPEIGGRVLRLKLAGDLTGVADAVRRLPAHQLVVLGEPGAGKSVLAMHFALAELAQRKPRGPVVILLSLADWDPRREHLHLWLARRISADYPILNDAQAYGRNAATRLVEEGLILPVLDGLDEMPAASIPEAIVGVNAAIGDRGVIVTCRSREYQSAVRQSRTTLSRAAVIEIEPVGATDAIDFLTGAEPADASLWKPVADELRSNPNGTFAKALSTPLMIATARSVCGPGGADRAELLNLARSTSVAGVNYELLRRLVPAAYAKEPPRLRSTRSRLQLRPGRAEKWLVYLANHLKRLNTQDLVWWRIAESVPAWLIGTIAGAATGLLSGAALVACIGLFGYLPASEVTWLVGVYCLLVGLPIGLTACRSTKTTSRPQCRRRFGEQITQALRDLLVLAVATSPFIVIPSESWADALSLGVPLWLCAAVLSGIVNGLRTEEPSNPRRASIHLREIARNAPAQLAKGLVIGVGIGIPFATLFLSDPLFGADAPSRAAFTLVATGLLGLGAIGLPLTLGRGLQSSLDKERTPTPQSGLRNDRRAFFAVILGTGLVVTALLATLGANFVPAPDLLEAVVLPIAIPVAMALALVTATASAPSQVCYLSAVVWLAVRGRLPWRPMRFLADAQNREVLRQTGSAYQFRHATLQEHLANQWPGSQPVRRGTNSHHAVARLRPWIKRIASAVPVTLLLVATFGAAEHSVTRLHAEAIHDILLKANSVDKSKPIVALRLRHAALALGPTEVGFDDPWSHTGLTLDDLLPTLLRYNGILRVSTVSRDTRAVFVSRDGKRLATIDLNDTATLWRINADGRLVDSTPLPDEYVTSVKFANDGTHLVSLGDGAVKVWIWTGGAEPKLVKDITVSLKSLDAGIDGDKIALLDADGSLHYWPWRGKSVARSGNDLDTNRSLPMSSTWLSLSDDGAAVVGLNVRDPVNEELTEHESDDVGIVVRNSGSGETTRFTIPYDVNLGGKALSLSYNIGFGTASGGYFTLGQLATNDVISDRWSQAAAIESNLSALAYSAKRAVFLSEDGSILIADPAQLDAAIRAFDSHPSRYVCDNIGRGLNQEEWAKYVPYSWLPELGYRPTCA